MYKTGYIVQLRYMISQHSRDQQLINNFVEFFNCGSVIKVLAKESAVEFRVSSLKDIINTIIPFFDKYPIKGAKSADFPDFRRIVEIMKTKGQLAPAGLAQIREIKAGMNKKRPNNLLLNSDTNFYLSSEEEEGVSTLRVSKYLKSPNTQKRTEGRPQASLWFKGAAPLRTFSSLGFKTNISCNKGRDTQLVVRETCLGYLQSELGGIGRFQLSSENTIRYIIGNLSLNSLLHKRVFRSQATKLNISCNKGDATQLVI